MNSTVCKLNREKKEEIKKKEQKNTEDRKPKKNKFELTGRHKRGRKEIEMLRETVRQSQRCRQTDRQNGRKREE